MEYTGQPLNYYRNVYVVDIESTGLNLDSRIHVLSCGYFSNSKWNIISTDKTSDIRKIFEDEDNIVVGHNFEAFDIEVIKNSIPDLDLQAQIIDTLYLSQYLRDGKMLKHGLEAWGDKLGYPKVKVHESEWQGLTDSQFKLFHDLTDTNRNNLQEHVYQELKTFKEAHYKRMEERCVTDVQINIKVWEELILSLYGLYNYDEGEVDRFLNKIAFKSRMLKVQSNNPVRVDVPLLEKNIGILEGICKEQKDKLESVMPQTPKFDTKKMPKIMYKKDGSLSANGQKWYDFLAKEGIPTDNELPVKYVKSYEPPNAGSPAQIKDFLDSLGWIPETFKDVPTSEVDERGRTIFRKVAQVRVDVDGQKELCPSVKRLISKIPELKSLDGLSVAEHRLGILTGVQKRLVGEYVVASASGIARTMRLKHSAPIK